MIPMSSRLSLLACLFVLSACVPGPVTVQKSPVPKASAKVEKAAFAVNGTLAVDPEPLRMEGLLIEKDGGLIISSNGAGLTSKTKLGRSAQAVAGFRVTAVSQLDGQVLAGPVDTDAKGAYRLAFKAAPVTNYRVEAVVAGKETDARFTYTTLLGPQASSEPVTTTDVTRASYRGLTLVLPERLRPVIEARKAGKSAELYLKAFPREEARAALQRLDAELAKLSVEELETLDADGRLGDRLTQRVLAYADLERPAFAAFRAQMAAVRQFEETLPDGKTVADAVGQAASSFSAATAVAQALTENGMPEAEAEALGQALSTAAMDVSVELAATFLARPDELLSILK